MCGEHHLSFQLVPYLQGSPPHVRGTPIQALAACFLLRITPACAGNTAGYWSLLQRLWDHPRMCGEHQIVPREI